MTLTQADLARLRELRVEVTPATWHFDRQADAEYICALTNAVDDGLLDLAERGLNAEMPLDVVVPLGPNRRTTHHVTVKSDSEAERDALRERLAVAGGLLREARGWWPRRADNPAPIMNPVQSFLDAIDTFLATGEAGT